MQNATAEYKSDGSDGSDSDVSPQDVEALMQSRWMSTEELAVVLGISKSSVEKMRLQGRGPAYYRMGRIIRYAAADVVRYIRTSRVELDASAQPPPSVEVTTSGIRGTKTAHGFQFADP